MSWPTVIISKQSELDYKLFILLNLRSYITDQDLEGFLDSVLLHGYNIFMIETCDHKRLQKESRIIVDNDLCVIKT